MNMSTLGGLALAALGFTATIPGVARAATAEGNDYGPAAGNCQGALPAFAGTLRARPLAIGNEGSGTAFVTCGPNGAIASGKTLRSFALKVGNAASTPITISCTFVHGIGGSNATSYITKDVTLVAGGSDGLSIQPADLGADAKLFFPQVSCQLPPGGLLYYTFMTYTYDVGN